MTSLHCNGGDNDEKDGFIDDKNGDNDDKNGDNDKRVMTKMTGVVRMMTRMVTMMTRVMTMTTLPDPVRNTFPPSEPASGRDMLAEITAADAHTALSKLS